MNALLWTTSSAVMAALLSLLAIRALHELLCINIIKDDWKSNASRLLSPANWPWPVVFVASLAILWLGAYVSYTAMYGENGFFQHFWSRFTEAGDSPHYLYIAENGYARAGEEINKIVFYPLYPLLMACLGALLGGRLELAGMIISQTCYGLSAVVLMKLAKKDCAHPGTALCAYWLYPFGFFCLGIFTEGLFLFLTILGLYLIRIRKWVAAGIVSLLCSLTRTQGILLILPGVYAAWQDCREKGWNWRYLALAGSVLGFGVYLILNKIVCGDYFAFRYYESISPWWQTTQWLGDTIVQQRDMALKYPGLSKWIYWPQLALYFIVAYFLFVGYHRRLDTSHILYGTAYLGMCYTASWLISGCRYLLGCVPMYLCIGQVKDRKDRYIILFIEFVFFWVYYHWYIQGQAIM